MTESHFPRLPATTALIWAVILGGILWTVPAHSRAPAAAPSASDRVKSVGAIPFQNAGVETPDGLRFTVTWAALGIATVRVYAGPSPERIDRARLVGQGGARGQLQISLPPAARWYFELVPSRGQPLVVADLNLRLAGAANFRDIGGLRTGDGRWVRMGLLYRSDQLDRLTDADLKTLDQLDIRLVCDLRTGAERRAKPDRLPGGASSLVADVLADVDIPGERSISSPEDLRALVSGGDPLPRVYRQMVSSPAAQVAYRTLFTRLAAPGGLPSVFHCTSGKDRTGWAAAVLLSFLGVPHEKVVEDYLASNAYLEAKNRAAFQRLAGRVDPASLAVIQRIMTVRREYIEASFDEVRLRYGSLEGYLHHGLGLDDLTLAALRHALLSRAPGG